jgi:hypothetical protein
MKRGISMLYRLDENELNVINQSMYLYLMATQLMHYKLASNVALSIHTCPSQSTDLKLHLAMKI